MCVCEDVSHSENSVSANNSTHEEVSVRTQI